MSSPSATESASAAHARRLMVYQKLAEFAQQLDSLPEAVLLLGQLVEMEPTRLDFRHLLRSIEIHIFQNNSKINKPINALKIRTILARATLAKTPADRMKIAEEGLALNPFHRGCNELLATGASDLGLFPIVAFAYETISMAYPNDTKPLHQLAETYQRTHSRDEAFNVYEQILSINPDDVEAQEALLRLQRLLRVEREGERVEANSSGTGHGAMSRLPPGATETPPGFRDLGGLLAGRAHPSWPTADELEGAAPSSKAGEAELHADRPREDEGAGLSGDDEEEHRRALIEELQGRIDVLEAEIGNDFQAADLHANELLLLRHELGSNQLASLEVARQHEPDNAEVLLEMGEVYATMGMFAESLASFDEASKEDALQEHAYIRMAQITIYGAVQATGHYDELPT